jgi:hypothetical protein
VAHTHQKTLSLPVRRTRRARTGGGAPSRETCFARFVGAARHRIDEAPEDMGTTFLENAVFKARPYAGRSGLLTVARGRD